VILLAPCIVVADVAGTAHDLSAGLTTTEVCVFCHTPHGGGTIGPLWNHSPSTSAVADYGAYSSSTMDTPGGTGGTFAPNDGSTSALCMGCHDGTVGVGSMVNNPNQGGAPTNAGTLIGAIGTGSADLGEDISNDHPVNFAYNNALFLADGELEDPATLPAAITLFGAGNDQLECASCHDPHEDVIPTFLVIDNTVASALCSTCHMK